MYKTGQPAQEGRDNTGRWFTMSFKDEEEQEVDEQDSIPF